MILKSLYEYYERKKETLPAEGFELKEIKFLIEINTDGEFVDLVDLREKKKGKLFLLPKAIARSGKNSWQKTFLLWDHYGYLLQHPKDSSSASIKMAEKQNEVFVKSLNELPQRLKEDIGVKAILLFYEKNNAEDVKGHTNWVECSKIPGCNLTFRLNGDTEVIPQREMIVAYQKSLYEIEEENNSSIVGKCLITGNIEPLSRLHTATPILGSKSNSKIVAFQKKSGFDSYGKEQAFNAPVSIKAEAAFSTALKHLLSSRTNKKIISDSTIVFWVEKETQIIDPEELFSWVIATQSAKEDDPDRGVEIISSLYDAIHTGKLPQERDNYFYVLGLSPNAARISVRFWKIQTVEEFGENIKKHFDDFSIVHGPKEYQHLSLYQILSSTALQYKMENVPPNLAGAVIESIIDGKPYPITLMHQCIRRIRAEQHVNRARAAILKAYINRKNRFYNLQEKEITMALDLTNSNSGYRMGRLFAVLEKIQEEANPGINTTIRDRFYGAASSSPVAVFSQLLKLKNHHMPKLTPGRKIFFEKLIAEVISELSSFPNHLPLNEQAYFSVGYYHQRQDFFTSKKNKNQNENEN
jgi:CRISPR-associated protein Csd1